MDTLKLNKQVREELISKHPLFSLLTVEDIKELVDHMYEIFVPAGMAIVSEGELVDSVYIMGGGIAEVTRHPVAGTIKEDIIVAKLAKGEGIGLTESGFFSKTGIRTATVTAATSVLLLGISIDHFNQFMSQPGRLYAGLQKSANTMLKMNLLKRADPFAMLTSEEIQKLVHEVKELSFQKGEMIFQKGEDSDQGFLIKEGEVEIIKNELSNEEIVAVLPPLSIFGMVGLLSSGKRTINARAKTECQLLALDRAVIHDIFHRDVFIDESRDPEKIIALKSGLFNRYSFPTKMPDIITSADKTADQQSIFVIKNPQFKTYKQLMEEEWFVWNLIDGNKSIETILQEHKQKYKRDETEEILLFLLELAQLHFILLPLAQEGMGHHKGGSFFKKLISIFKK